ncbi:MAG: methionyl-tRNA formyltransferase [Dehalococcoidia bacterium]|nr:methionyl-tRNA formyltransferase [Dehalococcoidia bacterium]
MRIVLIGQAAFGEKTLEAFLEVGEEMVGVYMPPDTPGRDNSFKQLAFQLGIPVFQPERMRSPEVYDSYVKLKPELNVMAFVTDIVPESILNYPKLSTIQYHPSLLPRHRGGSAINWAVINGETRTGLTIFWPGKGIDTGPILLQKEVDILPDDTMGSLYFKKLFPLGIEAIKESVELIRQGKAPRTPQDESQATYEGLYTQATIDWNQPVLKIYNLIRGANPQPGATTSYRSNKLKVFDSELHAGEVKGSSGEVIEVTESGFLVAAPGGAILIKRVQPAGSPKIAAAEFIAQSGLTSGGHLGE